MKPLKQKGRGPGRPQPIKKPNTQAKLILTPKPRKIKPEEFHRLENLVVAVMLDFPEPREYFLRRVDPVDFKSRYNRAVLYVLSDANGLVGIPAVYDYLAERGWAIEGIASHLAYLSGLGWQADREGDQL